MNKLSDSQIEEYFTNHLPYRNRILLTHKRICAKGPYYGDCGLLEACFEASLIAGRMYLNLLGISKNKNDKLIRTNFKKDDITSEDLGGKFVDIDKIPDDDKELFVGFLKMVDKGSAHLTFPMKHPWENTHAAIERIVYYLNEYLYRNTKYKFQEKC